MTVITQPLAFVGEVWTCAWCAAVLTDGAIKHRDDCTWIAEVHAAERASIIQLATTTGAVYLDGNGDTAPFAGLLAEDDPDSLTDPALD